MADRRLACAGITEQETDYHIMMSVQEYVIDEQGETWKSITGCTLIIPISTPPGNILAQVQAEGIAAAEKYDREQGARGLLNTALLGYTLP